MTSGLEFEDGKTETKFACSVFWERYKGEIEHCYAKSHGYRRLCSKSQITYYAHTILTKLTFRDEGVSKAP